MRLFGRNNRLNGALDVAFGRVFEANRHREAAAQFTVNLALGGSGSDCNPACHICNVLRKLKIKVFAGGWESELVDIEKEFPSKPESFIDVVALVQIRVINKPLPADAGSRLFEISTHENDELVFEAAGVGQELFGVFEDGLWVVDATGTDDHDQPVVSSVDGVRDRVAGVGNSSRDVVSEWHLLMQDRRRNHWPGVSYSEVVGKAHDGCRPNIIVRSEARLYPI